MTSPDLPTPLGITVPGWPRPSGYSNGVTASGRLVFTGGQIGWNPVSMEMESDDFVAQCAQVFRNISAVLAAGGAAPHHLVRLTWYVTDGEAYRSTTREVGAAYREVFGRHYPAMAVVIVAGLLESRAKVEIEATAVVPD